MKPTTWLVQTNVSAESVTPTLLRHACERQQKPYFELTVPPTSTALPPLASAVAGSPVVFHGRSRLILQALASPWQHGVFFDPNTFQQSAYAAGFGERLLNFSAQIMTWQELLSYARHTSGYRFIKPNNDFKGFTGQALALAQAEEFFSLLQAKIGDSALQTEVVVAELAEVDAEWRLFVVDGEIVAGSMYRPGGGTYLPPDMIAFAQAAIREWTPAAVFALDIGRIAQQWKIIECNCFNASRLYDADAEVIVAAVSRYQERRYSGLPNDQLMAMAKVS